MRPIESDYTVFVHVLDAEGQVRAQRDVQPMDGRAPTSWWLPGEVIRDEHILPLRDAHLPPGIYTLSIGMYHWTTGERLPLTDSNGRRLTDDRLIFADPIRMSSLQP